MKLADTQEMVIINEEQKTCKGLWTREQGKEKSVIDYVMIPTKTI